MTASPVLSILTVIRFCLAVVECTVASLLCGMWLVPGLPVLKWILSPSLGPDYGQFLKELGGRIKQLRHERGLSLRDMIVIHGYADSQWRRYERGGSVNVQTLLRICNAFKISLCVLLDGLGEYPTASVEEIRLQQQCGTQTPQVKSKVSAPKAKPPALTPVRAKSRRTAGRGANPSA